MCLQQSGVGHGVSRVPPPPYNDCCTCLPSPQAIMGGPPAVGAAMYTRLLWWEMGMGLACSFEWQNTRVKTRSPWSATWYRAPCSTNRRSFGAGFRLHASLAANARTLATTSSICASVMVSNQVLSSSSPSCRCSFNAFSMAPTTSAFCVATTLWCQLHLRLEAVCCWRVPVHSHCCCE